MKVSLGGDPIAAPHSTSTQRLAAGGPWRLNTARQLVITQEDHLLPPAPRLLRAILVGFYQVSDSSSPRGAWVLSGPPQGARTRNIWDPGACIWVRVRKVTLKALIITSRVML